MHIHTNVNVYIYILGCWWWFGVKRHAHDNYFHSLTAVESQDGLLEAEEAAEAKGKKKVF